MNRSNSRRKFLKRAALGTGLALAGAGLALRSSPAQAATYLGKYRGSVVTVTDPLQLGRIQAMVPAVLGSNPTGWALPAVPFAGAGHGLVLLPQVGDAVWIEFEQGDTNFPIWTGGWWSAGQLDPNDFTGAKRLLATETGHQILIDEGANMIQVLHAAGPTITLNGNSITLSVGATNLVISATGVYINNRLLAQGRTTPIVTELLLDD